MLVDLGVDTLETAEKGDIPKQQSGCEIRTEALLEGLERCDEAPGNCEPRAQCHHGGRSITMRESASQSRAVAQLCREPGCSESEFRSVAPWATPAGIKSHLEDDNTSRQQLLANVELELRDANVLEEIIGQGVATSRESDNRVDER